MSFLIDLVGGLIKTVSVARTASHATGLDAPALDELHDGLSPVRAQYMHARAHELTANASAGQAAQPTNPTDTDDGFISDVIDWIGDRIAEIF